MQLPLCLSARAVCHTYMAQVREQKPDLARLETMDMGKPIDEAEWDMVGSSFLPLLHVPAALLWLAHQRHAGAACS